MLLIFNIFNKLIIKHFKANSQLLSAEYSHLFAAVLPLLLLNMQGISNLA